MLRAGNAGLFISYRMGAGDDRLLPRFLREMCETACLGLRDVDETSRLQKNTRILCDAVAKRLEVIDLPYLFFTERADPRIWAVQEISENPWSNHVAAAAAFGNLQALRTALRGEVKNIWDESRLFGFPLVLAAGGGHFEIVRSILKQFEQIDHQRGIKEKSEQLTLAIEKALENRHVDVVLLLLRILHVYGPPTWPPDADRWPRLAMHTRSIEVIEQVRKVRWDYTVDAFRRACAVGDLKAVHMFLSEELVALHCVSSRFSLYMPIHEAVKSRNAKVVEMLLEMGADPDGGNMHNKSPLWIAVDNTDRDIVQLLLQYGANPEAQLERWVSQPQDWCKERRAIKSLLLKAEDWNEYFTPHTGPRTDLTIDAADLVLAD